MTPIREIADIVLEVRDHLSDSTQPTENMGGTQSEVVFHLRDELARQCGVETLQKRKPALREEVEVVLFAAAKWLWHLRRENSAGKLPGQMVSTNMLKIAAYSHSKFPVNRLQNPIQMPVRHPADIGSNQSSSSSMPGLPGTDHQTPSPAPASISVDGVIELSVSSALYGFNLKCDRRVHSPVYVRIFYFDTTDFSIKHIFGHTIGNGKNTPDIVPGGEMLTGDGADGGSPTRFNVSEGQGVELGYMKAFWSTQPLELDYITQGSAFDMKPGDMRGAGIIPRYYG
ncbi:hypothetical protein OPQ81_003630 [Rhizoctonia solani]|nr:hypothetical protein OPQ81_003630 [Rhizoctonia solani]